MMFRIPEARKLEADEYSPFGGVLKKALDNYKALTEAQYLPKEKEVGLRDALAKATKSEAVAKYADETENAALQKSLLENQWYAPEKQSEIGYRNAEANKLNKMTPLEATLKGLDIEKQKAEQPYWAKEKEAEINQKNAMKTYYESGGYRGQSGVDIKNLGAFSRQLAADFPMMPNEDTNQYNERLNKIQNAYLAGDTQVDGQPLPPLSGTSQQLLTFVQGKNAPAAVKTQAVNMDNLAEELNAIDIKPLQAFSGGFGKIKAAKYAATMAAGGEVPQEYRDYLAYKDVVSNFAMDSLRKGFGTSVVPSYVYATLGKAAQPGSAWWNDAGQVATEMEAVKKWVNKNAEDLKRKATLGLNAKDKNSPENKKNPKDMTDEEIRKELEQYG